MTHQAIITALLSIFMAFVAFCIQIVAKKFLPPGLYEFFPAALAVFIICFNLIYFVAFDIGKLRTELEESFSAEKIKVTLRILGFKLPGDPK